MINLKKESERKPFSPKAYLAIVVAIALYLKLTEGMDLLNSLLMIPIMVFIFGLASFMFDY